MNQDSDVAMVADGDTSVEELLVPGAARGPGTRDRASLERRPGISKVLRELRIEFDQR
jgi:hypothetical protein